MLSISLKTFPNSSDLKSRNRVRLEEVTGNTEKVYKPESKTTE